MRRLILYVACCFAISNSTAIYAQSNGCGSENSLGSPGVIQFLDAQSAIDFKNACNQHDIDYGTAGVSKQQADIDFYNNMMNACKKYEGTTTNTILRNVDAKKHCERNAATYYYGVKAFGNDAYEAAQRKAKNEFNNGAGAYPY